MKPGTVAFAGLIIGAGAIAIALVSGLPYEQAQRARDRELFPQVGRSVDIGGRTLIEQSPPISPPPGRVLSVAETLRLCRHERLQRRPPT
jgi:hypothetical protein